MNLALKSCCEKRNEDSCFDEEKLVANKCIVQLVLCSPQDLPTSGGLLKANCLCFL